MHPLTAVSRFGLVNSALLALVFFLIPIKIVFAYVASGLLLLLWIAEGRWQEKWQRLRSNPVFWILQSYFWVLLISLLWSQHLDLGISMTTRYLLFALAGVYFTAARREHAGRYFAAFAAGVVVCEFLAGYNWLRHYHFPQWPPGFRSSADVLEMAPFVDRIMFGPILAFCAYISAWGVWTGRAGSRWLWFAVWLSTVASLAISAGRAGTLSFALMMGLLTLQMLAKRRGVAVLSAAAVLVLSGLALYSLSDSNTRMRLSTGIAESQRLESDPTASLPLRYHMARNTLQIFVEQPLLGVGAGDFRSAYEQIKNRLSPSLPVTRNPHNEILFAAATTGVLGLLSLAVMWFVPAWLWRHQRDELSALRIGLPAFFLMICLSESYLWLPNTGLMFVLFMSVLYGPPKPVASATVSNPVHQQSPSGTTP